MSDLNLASATNEELDALFAEHVAGDLSPGGQFWHADDESHMDTQRNYCGDMEAVLPWLEKCGYDVIIELRNPQFGPRYSVWILMGSGKRTCGAAGGLPRACVIALLRTKKDNYALDGRVLS